MIPKSEAPRLCAVRDAGVSAELHVLEAAAHGAFGNRAPEEAELDAEIRGFCEKAWG